MLKRIVIILILLSMPLHAELYKGWDEDSPLKRTATILLGTTIVVIPIPVLLFTSKLNHEKKNDHSNVQLKKLINDNFQNIVKDIAQGNGESIEAIAKLCAIDDHQQLGELLQKNFDDIYTKHDIKSEEMTTNIIFIINGF